MGRKPVECFPGAVLHIIQRGNNKNYIFADDADKKAFLQIISDLLELFDFQMLFYCLMDNHYHLILLMGDDLIGKIMQRLNASYARYYNKRHDCIGTVFCGRYKGILMRSDRQFFRTLHYIAHNPVKAKMAGHPNEYRWGAHYAMINGDFSLIARSELLRHFSDDEVNGIRVILDDRILGLGASGLEAAAVDAKAHEVSVEDKNDTADAKAAGLADVNAKAAAAPVGAVKAAGVIDTDAKAHEVVHTDEDVAFRRYCSFISKKIPNPAASYYPDDVPDRPRGIGVQLPLLLDEMGLPAYDKRSILSGNCNAVQRLERMHFAIRAFAEGIPGRDIAHFLSVNYETVRRLIAVS